MSVGPMQLLIILVLVFVLFGAGKLPRVMGDIGKGIRNMKEGLNAKDDQTAKTIEHNDKDSSKG